MFATHPEALGHAGEEQGRLIGIHAVVGLLIGIQRRVLPDRLAVAPPEAVQRPARQLLTGVPLALAEMHQRLRRIVRAQPVEQLGGQTTLVRAQRRGVPLGIIGVIEGDEGRLATHGQAHIALRQIAVDLLAEADDRLPLLGAVRFGDTRRFPHPLHAHGMNELALTLVDQAADRRGR